MKRLLTIPLLLSPLLPLQAQNASLTPERIANTIILDPSAVQNLQLQTALIEERTFQTTIFAIGRIEEIPARHHSISSRIAGRAIEINAFAGDHVKKGQVLAKIESRQPGNPPPSIELKALSDGIIIESHVLKGQPVSPDKDLLDIADRSQMWAIAKIPEQEAPQFKIGMQARIHIPALGGKPILARLIRYGVTADRHSGTIDGIFQLPNPQGHMLPGMRVEFALITAQRKNILAAPRNALQGDPAHRVMYIKDFELPNAYIRTPVILGKENDQYIEILSGLFPGDEVVTQGSYSLGFVGSGASLSLKETLDAAHGHEHNEDGSEMTPAQKTNNKNKDHPPAEKKTNSLNKILLLYAIALTTWHLLSRKNNATKHNA